METNQLPSRKPYQPSSPMRIKQIVKQNENTDLSLDVTKQKFNPGSPPINEFMHRLAARNLFYQGK